MKFIAHRGLIDGPNSSIENRPLQVKSALDMGLDCEIDLRLIDNRLMLGHDGPQYEVDIDFLHQPGLWIHCKNYAALAWCSTHSRLNYFWHDTDAYTLTSHKYIWAYPGQAVNYPLTVQVMPEMADPGLNNIDWTAFGVCSDYVLRLQAQRPKSLR